MAEENKKYLVLFRAKASIRIGGKAELEINRKKIDFKINISDIVIENNGYKNYKYLEFEVLSEHGNIDIAVSESISITKFLLMLFCFSASAHVEPPIPLIAYDITPVSSKREHVQYFFEPKSLIPNTKKRMLDDVKVEMLTKNFFKSERHDRIGRAILWYTKFLSEDDNVARFSFLWIGMEALNPLLEEKLGSVKEKRKCKECGYEEDISSPIGVRDFIEKHIEGGSDLYKAIKQSRNEILHGFKTMKEINSKVKPLIDELDKIIKKSILFLLDIEITTENNWFLKSIAKNQYDYIKHKSVINVSDIETFIDKKGHPHFKLDKEIIESFNDSGRIEGTLRAHLHPNFNTGFDTEHVEIYFNNEQKIVTTNG